MFFVEGNPLDLAKYLFIQIQGIAVFNSVEQLKIHHINPNQLIAYILKKIMRGLNNGIC